MTAAATGNPAPTVQWQVSTNGGTTFTNISGATSTSYSFTAAATQNGNEYGAVFTNASLGYALRGHIDDRCRSTTQTVQPDGLTAAPASPLRRPAPTPAATRAMENEHRRRHDLHDISGATSATYSFTAAAAQNGDEYQAVFTNSGGTLTSDSATLTVDFAPTVSTNPTL